MDSERWERIWAIFHDALERGAGADRDAFLEAECGEDAELRAEVESLLAAHEDESAPEPGPRLAPTVRLAEEAPAGSTVGPYRIVRPIAEGGMGIVYEAEQEEPVRRRVALKLIKAGMDTREVVRRFEAERQALAVMDHSSIARVFDAGATEQGRPYFAMELVDGPPLTRYCDAERLPVRERVALFATVCRAVHSAHQKGVIHRDLKSTNVLIATEEGRAVPKVIDFGIARAVQRPFTGESMVTGLGQLLGTPETMSPEQAAMSPDLDTRTDIYSLGALLYELLAGVRAFSFHDLSLAETLHRIREVDPPAPSARFSSAEPDATLRAELRGSTPAHLARELRGEPDWIVARAMAKERERRYGSAAELAADLERYLEDQPVAAGPPSRLYRARKLLRRHRFETAAAVALVAAIVAFGVTMALQSRRLARALEAEERERATSNKVSAFLVDLLERPDPAIARGSDPTIRDVLDGGAEKLERELAGEPEIQARLLDTIGRVQLNLGDFDRAEPVLLKAAELRRRLHPRGSVELAATLEQLAGLEYERARWSAALAHGREALEMRRRLLPADDPAIAESLDVIGVILRQTGDLAGSEKLHLESLALRRAALGEDDPAVADSWNYLGIARRWRADTAGAEEAYRKAFEIWRRALGDDHPKTAMAMNNLALVLHVRGDHAASEEIFEQLVPLRRRLLGDAHPDLQVTLANHAKLLHDMGELERSAELYEESLAVGRRGVGEETAHMANAFSDYSTLLAKLGRDDEAMAAAQKARGIRERLLGVDHPSYAGSLADLAEVHETRGNFTTAAALLDRSVEILRRVAPGEPRLAEGLELLALFLLRRGDAEAALPLLEEAVGILRERLPPGHRGRARAEGSLGLCLLRLGRLDEAEPLLEASLARLSTFETSETAEARDRLAELRRARQGTAAASR